jgi:hypothetical protein
VDVRKRNDTNRLNGSAWEEIFLRQARSKGLLAIKVPLSARIIGPKRVLPIKSFLDYQLIRRDGRVSFLDTKTYADKFTYSEVNPSQLEKASLYEEWGIPSGFVVWFRKSNDVSYFSSEVIKRVGPGHSFTKDMGLCLGQIANFDLNRIFMAARSCPSARSSGPEPRQSH